MLKIVRSFLLVGAVLGLGMSAGAVSLTVTASSLIYNPGDIISLDVAGDSEGGVAGALSVIISSTTGDSSLSNTSLDDLVGRTGAPFFWQNTGSAGQCIVNCLAADAFEFVAFGGVPVALTGGALSSWALDTTGASGDIVITLTPDDSVDVAGGFFGAGPVQITLTQIPEPTTGVLMGFGLMGLAIAGRSKK